MARFYVYMLYKYMCIHMYIHMYVHISVHMYGNMYIYICIRIYICLHMYIHMYKYMYIHMHVHIYVPNINGSDLNHSTNSQHAHNKHVTKLYFLCINFVINNYLVFSSSSTVTLLQDFLNYCFI